MKRSIWLACASAAWLFGCGGGGLGGAASPGSSKLAAQVDGVGITEGELDARAKDRLYARETNNGDPSTVYELRREALDSWIEEQALSGEAKRRNLTVDEMIAADVAARGAVSDADVNAFFEQNKASMQGHPLEELAPRIRSHLEAQRVGEARQAIVAKAKVDVLLEAPRVSVASDGPSQGPADAPITLVEFSDFQCPFCARAVPVIKALQERYPTQLRVVYKHLPLESIHPRARAAAEASVCAEEQGKFWPFHDRLFENRTFSDADLLEDAKAVGLDLAKFDACLKSDSHRARIEANMAEANAVGIQGTPAFVLNGLLVRGLQPPEAFAQMIDRELATLAKAEPPAAEPKASP